jgi:hypothetical protein
MDKQPAQTLEILREWMKPIVQKRAEAKAEESARFRENLLTEICYRGFAYNVRSQSGIDSLRRAIERNGEA